MVLFKSPICVIDTETSGLPRNPWGTVVELAGVLLDVGGEEVDFFATFVKPVHPLPTEGKAALEVDKALAVSGITRAMIDAAPGALIVHNQWAEWQDEHGWKYATAFNVEFDQLMVEERLGLRPMQWAPCIMLRAMELMGPAGALREANPHHPAFDPGRPWLFPSLTRKNDRDGAAEFFGVQHETQTHRALDDARIAAGILCAIRRRQLDAAARAA